MLIGSATICVWNSSATRLRLDERRSAAVAEAKAMECLMMHQLLWDLMKPGLMMTTRGRAVKEWWR
jgi:hypothetical protein